MQKLPMPKTNFQKVQEFNRAFDMVPKEPVNYHSGELNEIQKPQVDAFIYIRPELFIDSPKIIKLRLNLIDEEIEELNHAIATNDFVETRDALADILYVVYGMADVLGINIDTLFIDTLFIDDIDCNDIQNEVSNRMFSSISKYKNQDKTNNKPIGLTNFDWIRLVCDSLEDGLENNLKVIQGYINENYNKLEEYCLSNEEKVFSIIAKYICQLLKYVYIYSYIAGIDANADFAIVHSSNMSKLCESERDAITTVADYIEKYVAGKSPYDSPYYYELPELGKWIVKNKSTGKVLKNIKYQKVVFYQ